MVHTAVFECDAVRASMCLACSVNETIDYLARITADVVYQLCRYISNGRPADKEPGYQTHVLQRPDCDCLPLNANLEMHLSWTNSNRRTLTLVQRTHAAAALQKEKQLIREKLSSLACFVCAVVSLLAGDKLGGSSKSIVDGRVCTCTGSHQVLSRPRCHAMKLSRWILPPHHSTSAEVG